MQMHVIKPLFTNCLIDYYCWYQLIVRLNPHQSHCILYFKWLGSITHCSNNWKFDGSLVDRLTDHVTKFHLQSWSHLGLELTWYHTLLLTNGLNPIGHQSLLSSSFPQRPLFKLDSLIPQSCFWVIALVLLFLNCLGITRYRPINLISIPLCSNWTPLLFFLCSGYVLILIPLHMIFFVSVLGQWMWPLFLISAINQGGEDFLFFYFFCLLPGCQKGGGGVEVVSSLSSVCSLPSSCLGCLFFPVPCYVSCCVFNHLLAYSL